MFTSSTFFAVCIFFSTLAKKRRDVIIVDFSCYCSLLSGTIRNITFYLKKFKQRNLFYREPEVAVVFGIHSYDWYLNIRGNLYLGSGLGFN